MTLKKTLNRKTQVNSTVPLQIISSTRNLKVVRIFRPGTSGSLDVLITTTTTAPGL